MWNEERKIDRQKEEKKRLIKCSIVEKFYRNKKKFILKDYF